MENNYKSIKSFRKDIPLEGYEENVDKIQEFIISQVDYDENNHVLQDITYDRDGTVIQKYVYKYDTAGNLIESSLFYENDELADYKTFEYNDNGKISTEKVHYMDNSFDTIIFTYDSNNLLIEKTTKDNEGNIDGKEIFEYENNKLILKAEFDADSKKFNESKFKYDSQGQLKETEEWDSQDNTVKKTLNTYDENSNLIKQLNYVNDKLVSKKIYNIDENKHITNILDENISRLNNTEISYDDKGNPFIEKEYNKSGNLNHEILRTYNDKNDVLQSVVFIDNHDGTPSMKYVIRYEYDYR